MAHLQSDLDVDSSVSHSGKVHGRSTSPTTPLKCLGSSSDPLPVDQINEGRCDSGSGSVRAKLPLRPSGHGGGFLDRLSPLVESKDRIEYLSYSEENMTCDRASTFQHNSEKRVETDPSVSVELAPSTAAPTTYPRRQSATFCGPARFSLESALGACMPSSTPPSHPNAPDTPPCHTMGEAGTSTSHLSATVFPISSQPLQTNSVGDMAWYAPPLSDVPPLTRFGVEPHALPVEGDAAGGGPSLVPDCPSGEGSQAAASRFPQSQPRDSDASGCWSRRRASPPRNSGGGGGGGGGAAATRDSVNGRHSGDAWHTVDPRQSSGDRLWRDSSLQAHSSGHTACHGGVHVQASVLRTPALPVRSASMPLSALGGMHVGGVDGSGNEEARSQAWKRGLSDRGGGTARPSSAHDDGCSGDAAVVQQGVRHPRAPLGHGVSPTGQNVAGANVLRQFGADGQTWGESEDIINTVGGGQPPVVCGGDVAALAADAAAALCGVGGPPFGGNVSEPAAGESVSSVAVVPSYPIHSGGDGHFVPYDSGPKGSSMGHRRFEDLHRNSESSDPALSSMSTDPPSQSDASVSNDLAHNRRSEVHSPLCLAPVRSGSALGSGMVSAALCSLSAQSARSLQSQGTWLSRSDGSGMIDGAGSARAANSGAAAATDMLPAVTPHMSRSSAPAALSGSATGPPIELLSAISCGSWTLMDDRPNDGDGDEMEGGSLRAVGGEDAPRTAIDGASTAGEMAGTPLSVPDAQLSHHALHGANICGGEADPSGATFDHTVVGTQRRLAGVAERATSCSAGGAVGVGGPVGSGGVVDNLTCGTDRVEVKDVGNSSAVTLAVSAPITSDGQSSVPVVVASCVEECVGGEEDFDQGHIVHASVVSLGPMLSGACASATTSFSMPCDPVLAATPRSSDTTTPLVRASDVRLAGCSGSLPQVAGSVRGACYSCELPPRSGGRASGPPSLYAVCSDPAMSVGLVSDGPPPRAGEVALTSDARGTDPAGGSAVRLSREVPPAQNTSPRATMSPHRCGGGSAFGWRVESSPRSPAAAVLRPSSPAIQGGSACAISGVVAAAALNTSRNALLVASPLPLRGPSLLGTGVGGGVPALPSDAVAAVETVPLVASVPTSLPPPPLPPAQNSVRGGTPVTPPVARTPVVGSSPRPASASPPAHDISSPSGRVARTAVSQEARGGGDGVALSAPLPSPRILRAVASAPGLNLGLRAVGEREDAFGAELSGGGSVPVAGSVPPPASDAIASGLVGRSGGSRGDGSDVFSPSSVLHALSCIRARALPQPVPLSPDSNAVSPAAPVLRSAPLVARSNSFECDAPSVLSDGARSATISFVEGSIAGAEGLTARSPAGWPVRTPSTRQSLPQLQQWQSRTVTQSSSSTRARHRNRSRSLQRCETARHATVLQSTPAALAGSIQLGSRTPPPRSSYERGSHSAAGLGGQRDRYPQPRSVGAIRTQSAADVAPAGRLLGNLVPPWETANFASDGATSASGELPRL